MKLLQKETLLVEKVYKEKYAYFNNRLHNVNYYFYRGKCEHCSITH